MICPKCGMEYVPGVTMCTECKVALVEEEPQVAERIAVCKGNEQLANRMTEFLTYCKIKNVEKEYNEVEDTWYIIVDAEDADMAIKQASVLISQEYQQDRSAAEPFKALDGEDTASTDAENATDEPELIIPEAESTKGGAFVAKKAKYEDLKGTAVSFISVGSAALVLDILLFAGVLKLSFLAESSQVMMKIMLIIVGGIFLFIGIQAQLKTKGMKEEVAQEDTATEKIMSDFTSAYTGEDIDAQIYRIQADISDDLLPFQRLELIKRLVQKQHPEVNDDAFLDEMCDQIYSHYYD